MIQPTDHETLAAAVAHVARIEAENTTLLLQVRTLRAEIENLSEANALLTAENATLRAMHPAGVANWPTIDITTTAAGWQVEIAAHDLPF